MSAISYKCPNCGGELVFDPKTQKFQCAYCVSLFTEAELEAVNPGKEMAGEKQPGSGDKKQQSDDTQKPDGQEEAVVYSCPSCGAEIITDATTAATFCYYCHNPVVLQGRLSGDYLPDQILPFRVDRKDAEQAFLDFVHKKRFIPQAFFRKEQIEKLTGVYFPYWVCDCSVEADMDAKATKIRVWRVGDIEYTETKFYEVERGGTLEFHEMTNNALKKANRELVEGVQPFPMKDCRKFAMEYLSGFQAEKRDQEKEEFRDGLEQEVRGYTTDLLRDSISGYSSVVPKHTGVVLEQSDWNYVLLPVWTLTYRGRNDQIYYYTMNGITGKVCGKLPLDYRKVGILAVAVFLPILLLGLLGGYYI